MSSLPYTSIPNTSITLYMDGKAFAPKDGYIIGTPNDGAVITIDIRVQDGIEHRCYTLNTKMNSQPKKAIEPNRYQKKVTVSFYFDEGVTMRKIASFPGNMVVLEIGGKTFNIGIICQNGHLYFHISELKQPIEFNELLPIGTVLSANPFRGTAVINLGDFLDQARIHYGSMPYREDLKIRFLIPGEVIRWKPENLIELPANIGTMFRYEIKAAELA